jgi:hypothetical protein
MLRSSIWNRPDERDCQYKQPGHVGDCYDPGSAAAYCYAGAEPSLAGVGFERDWLTALWALERFDGCGIPFAVITDIMADASPLAWINGSARQALIEAAPQHLSRGALDCLQATLTTRIIP